MIENEQLTMADQGKVYKYFTNEDIAKYLITQIRQLYFSPISKNFTFSLSIESLHLFIYFHRSQPLQNSPIQDWQEMHGCYAIKITKGFPVSGLRVHILSNSYTPRLFDCRDISDEIVGGVWTYKNRLIDILINIDRFQSKLAMRANQDLAMQKTGEFKIGDLFDAHELKKFSSLNLFQDLTREDGPVLATTQTHFLTFKKTPQKDPSTSTHSQVHKIYQLVRACDIQCINQIYHNKKCGEIIVTFCKYKVIKSFNEHEKISRKYRIEDSEQFLRNVLKNIGRFQKIQVNLELGSLWNSDPAGEKIAKKLWQIKETEQALQSTPKPKQSKQLTTHLSTLYHKIIEYFSERANSYYLIYVAKLNKMHQNNHQIQSPKTK